MGRGGRYEEEVGGMGRRWEVWGRGVRCDGEFLL